jgi:hypothetical protein
MQIPALGQQFLAWQCLIRQYAARQLEGQPPTGAKPELQIDGRSQGPIVTLISKRDATKMTAQFQFIARKMHDPRLRREAVLKHLAETYYQKSISFTDQLTGLFKLDSPLAKSIVLADSVYLFFTQSNQKFIIPCETKLCDKREDLYQFTYWHNYLFNPTLPGAVDIVCFMPDWKQASFTDLNKT